MILFRDAIHDDVSQVLSKNSPAALMTNSLSLKTKQQVAPSGMEISQSQPIEQGKVDPPAKQAADNGEIVLRKEDEEEKKQGE